ncbi:MAG TPA: amidophosphoribosyltransferase [Kofleriaceae bacterium]|nr:amidophosphoribosyltransferase [Kofleriaceae bacterium]
MCGVFGIHGHHEAANIAYLGMHALQHRGQESAGLVAAEDGRLRRHVAMSLVSDAFDRDELTRLPGRTAIGHVRYSTAGSSELRNAQPFMFEYAGGAVSIGHNGNLVNADELRTELEAQGSIFQTSSDTEVIIHLMAKAREPDLVGKIRAALARVRGAYSLVLLTNDEKMIAVRDPDGFRPLAIGRLKEAIVVSSETCAFDLVEAEFIREVEPGEIVVIEKGGMTSHRLVHTASPHPCIFEHVYFARPDSLVNGKSVYKARERMGMRLAQEQPAPLLGDLKADVVIPVPDSGVPAAIGFSKESGIPFEMGLIRSHYVGRTFIEPQDSIRHFGVRLKLSPVRAIIDGKRVVVVDDSLVRGTTSRKIVKMLRNAGAREVHLRISAPPTTHPCFYGIDTPNRSELVAASHTVDEIARYVTCDSLGYLSHAGMVAAVGGATADPQAYCSACFTGEYPVALGQSTLVQIRRAGV